MIHKKYAGSWETASLCRRQATPIVRGGTTTLCFIYSPTTFIGSRNNQNFVQIPFYSLRNKLKSLCERYGLIYQEQEESYTSKASAIDGDDLPIYNADKPTTYQFSGKRVKRGLYRSKDGHLINSDTNGAANIGRKSKQNGFAVRDGEVSSPEERNKTTGLSRGCLAQPLRIKVY